MEEDRKDNGSDREEAREPPTEGTWRRPNPAPQESPHETKILAAQRYHPEKTPLMPWHAGTKTERAHPERDERRREGDHEDVKEALHDAEKEDEAPHRTGKSRGWPIGGPHRDVSKIVPVGIRRARGVKANRNNPRGDSARSNGRRM